MSLSVGEKFLAGNLALKVQDKIFALNRSMSNGTEYYTVEVPDGTSLGITDASRYAFIINGTNTTSNPVFRLGNISLSIVNNLGQPLSPGDLINGAMEELYCITIASGQIRMRQGVQSYNSLTDKPSIDGKAIVGNKTALEFGLASASNENNIMSIKVGEVIYGSIYPQKIGQNNETVYSLGDKRYVSALVSKTRPYWFNGSSYAELATKEDVDNIVIVDNYKGVLQYCRDTVEEMNEISDAKANDKCLVISDGATYSYNSGTWSKVEEAQYVNGDYFEVEEFSDNLAGRVVYNGQSEKWDVFKDYQGIPDGVTISRNLDTNVISVVKVPNTLSIKVGENSARVYDGSEPVILEINPVTVGAASVGEVNKKVNKGTVSNGNLITQDSAGNIVDLGISKLDVVTVAGGRLYASNISVSSSDESTIKSKLDVAAYLNKANNFLTRPSVNGIMVALSNELYDDSSTLKVTSQSWTEAQKQQARINIGAGTGNFDGDYNELLNKPAIDGIEISEDSTKKELGIYPSLVLNVSGNDYVLVSNPDVTPEMIKNVVNHKNGDVVSISELQSVFAGIGEFYLSEAYIDGVYYKNFSEFTSPINFETLVYNKIQTVLSNGETSTDIVTITFDTNSSIGNVVYRYKYPDKIDTSVEELLYTPVVLQRKEPIAYQFSDSYIVSGGTGYSPGDIVYASTFAITVLNVNGIGAITQISQFSDDVKNEERTTNYAGNYNVTGGSGSGAVIKLRTHYVAGDIVARGKLSDVDDSDPVAQETFVLGQINKATSYSEYYNSGRKYKSSKISFENSVPEISVTTYSDNDDAVVISDLGLLVTEISSVKGSYFRDGGNYYKLQTRDDVIAIVTEAATGLYRGQYKYFGDKASILSSMSLVNGDTAITKDTFEEGTYNGTSWSWQSLDMISGSYADVSNMLDYPISSGRYNSGRVTYYKSGEDAEWIEFVNEAGQADGVTLQQNQNGSIGFKFNSDGTIAGADATTIRVSQSNPTTLSAKIASIESNVSTINTSLSNNKISRPAEQPPQNNVAVWNGTSKDVIDSGVNISSIVKVSGNQSIAGDKTFTGSTSFMAINVGGAANFTGSVTINAGTPYTTTNKPTAAELGVEPSIVKNTAFNKNFGTTQGTVAEGNDGRFNALQINADTVNVSDPNGHSHKLNLTRSWINNVIANDSSESVLTLDAGTPTSSKITMKPRKGTSSEWQNIVLLDGEPGYETDTGRMKIGDGLTVWQELPYLKGDKVYGLPDGGNTGQFLSKKSSATGDAEWTTIVTGLPTIISELDYAKLVEDGEVQQDTLYYIQGTSDSSLAVTKGTIEQALGLTEEKMDLLISFAKLLSSVDTSSVNIAALIKANDFDTIGG